MVITQLMLLILVMTLVFHYPLLVRKKIWLLFMEQELISLTYMVII